MPIIYIDRALSTVFFIGPVGTDAGGWQIDLSTGEITPVPGWEAMRLSEVLAATEALQVATRFKDPRLQKQVIAPLASFVAEELNVQFGDAAATAG